MLAFGEAVLDRVAAELNDRPRKRFGYAKPNELIGHLLLPTAESNPREPISPGSIESDHARSPVTFFVGPNGVNWLGGGLAGPSW